MQLIIFNKGISIDLEKGGAGSGGAREGAGRKPGPKGNGGKADEAKKAAEEKRTKELKEKYPAEVGEYGAGYFVTESGEPINITSDFGDGTNDHVGFLSACEDEALAGKIGISKEDQELLNDYYMSGGNENSEDAGRITDNVLKSNYRVRIFKESGAKSVIALDTHMKGKSESLKNLAAEIAERYNLRSPQILLDTPDDYGIKEFEDFIKSLDRDYIILNKGLVIKGTLQ